MPTISELVAQHAPGEPWKIRVTSPDWAKRSWYRPFFLEEKSSNWFGQDESGATLQMSDACNVFQLYTEPKPKPKVKRWLWAVWSETREIWVLSIDYRTELQAADYWANAPHTRLPWSEMEFDE